MADGQRDGVWGAVHMALQRHRTWRRARERIDDHRDRDRNPRVDESGNHVRGRDQRGSIVVCREARVA